MDRMRMVKHLFSKSAITKIQAIVIAAVIAIALVGAYFALTRPAPLKHEGIPEEYAAIMAQLPDYYPDDYWKIIDAAKKEGKLVIYSTLAGYYWDPVVEDFKKLYPFIEVEWTKLTSIGCHSRYYSETASGIPSADMFHHTVPHLFYLAYLQGELLEYKSVEEPYLYDWQRISGYIYISTLTDMPISVNKVLIPPDMLSQIKGYRTMTKVIAQNPEFWRGKICGYDPVLEPIGYQWLYKMYKEFGDEFWQWLSVWGDVGYTGYTSSGTMAEKVNAGEHYICPHNFGGPAYTMLNNSPNTFGLIFPEEGEVIGPRFHAITKKATHPNAAKLMCDYLLSKRGQLLVKNVLGGSYIARKDITAEEEQFTIDALMKKTKALILGFEDCPGLLDEGLKAYILDMAKKCKIIS
jgi:iron(III) transport system substrate-binding protein